MIDLLRCVNDHEDTWLVASFTQITNRMVIEGTLGCPICSAEYEITGGVADFTLGEPVRTEDYQPGAASGGGGSDEPVLATKTGGDLAAPRPTAAIVVAGRWGNTAQK